MIYVVTFSLWREISYLVAAIKLFPCVALELHGKLLWAFSWWSMEWIKNVCTCTTVIACRQSPPTRSDSTLQNWLWIAKHGNNFVTEQFCFNQSDFYVYSHFRMDYLLNREVFFGGQTQILVIKRYGAQTFEKSYICLC